MAASERLSGSFERNGENPSLSSSPTVLTDFRSGFLGWSNGAVRATSPNLEPTSAQPWHVLGWSVRLQCALQFFNAFNQQINQPWGKVGDLWAGISIGENITNAGGFDKNGNPIVGGAVLPQQLSNFAKVLDGDNDHVASVLSVSGSFVPTPIGVSFMLPSPVLLQAGDDLQMVLVKTPVLTAGDFYFMVLQADYTVFYELAS